MLKWGSIATGDDTDDDSDYVDGAWDDVVMMMTMILTVRLLGVFVGALFCPITYMDSHEVYSFLLHDHFLQIDSPILPMPVVGLCSSWYDTSHQHHSPWNIYSTRSS